MKHFLTRLFSKWVSHRREGSARDVIHDILSDPAEAIPSLDEEERLLMKNILQLRDETVEDIMMPRVDIVAISKDIDFDHFIKLVSKQPFTRLLVYGKTLDDLKGFIHVKDVFQLFKNKTLAIKDIIQKPLIVACSLPVIDLLVMMRDTRIPIAVVVDEFGGVDGLITAWDIAKELFGDMENLPISEGTSLMTLMKDGTYEADARLPLEEFTQQFGIVLQPDEEEDEIDTLGGLIVSLIGRVPARQEIINHPQGIDFIILSANPRRIERVKIVRSKKI